MIIEFYFIDRISSLPRSKFPECVFSIHSHVYKVIQHNPHIRSSGWPDDGPSLIVHPSPFCLYSNSIFCAVQFVRRFFYAASSDIFSALPLMKAKAQYERKPNNSSSSSYYPIKKPRLLFYRKSFGESDDIHRSLVSCCILFVVPMNIITYSILMLVISCLSIIFSLVCPPYSSLIRLMINTENMTHFLSDSSSLGETNVIKRKRHICRVSLFYIYTAVRMCDLVNADGACSSPYQSNSKKGHISFYSFSVMSGRLRQTFMWTGK